MSTYNKIFLTFEKQLNLLKSRGLEITNDLLALKHLQRLGYYRLSGYLYPWRKIIPQPKEAHSKRPKREDTFIKGARFQNAVELYIFDKKLRLLILDAIERIEVAFRVDIAYLLGKKDTFAYTKPDLLHTNFTKKINPKTGKTEYENWLTKHEQLIQRSREDFVGHFKSKYGLPLPIWVTIELWDFGLLSFFYQGMAIHNKTEIAKKYDIPDWKIMESWLRCLNYVRNVVAHHSRLWNKNLIDQPKIPKKGQIPEFDFFIGNKSATSRVYIVLCVLTYFMQRVYPNSSWPKRVVDLIRSFPYSSQVSIQDMGFPIEWEKHAFWQNLF